MKTIAAGYGHDKQVFLLTALSPMILYMSIFALLPILWAVLLAFFDYSALRTGGAFLGLGGSNPFVGLGNFQNMLTGQSLEAQLFRLSFFNTILFAGLVLPLNLLITIPLAVLVNTTHQAIRPIFRLIFFLPIVTSSVGVAIMWGFIYHPQSGLLNGTIVAVGSMLESIGLPAPSRQIWLTSNSAEALGIPLPMLAVVVAYLWQDFGYNTIIFTAALQGIPETFSEAAKVDGANPMQVFWFITLPQLKPTILFTSVLTLISAFQVFALIYVLNGGGPQNQNRVLTIDIYENAFANQRMGWASAVSIVLFLLVLVITIVQFRLLRSDWDY
jgi:ABC-type sugar transport system permease subunit